MVWKPPVIKDILSRFQHDEQGRLTAHTQHQNGRQTQSRQYLYGTDGNLSQMTDSRFGSVYYDYDPLSRLKKTRGVVDESFAHDPAGNLLEQAMGVEAGRKPFSVEGNQLRFHGDTHYEYDEFGRLTAEKRGKEQSLVTHYDYDCQHRLTKAKLPDGSFATYKYDAFGRRVEKRVTDKLGNVRTTEFVWQGDTLIAETSNDHYQTYIYEPGTFKPLVMLSGEGTDCEVYHYHLDQIGTPTDITDLHGKSVWSVQYRAYGNVLRKYVEEITSPLRFQGQYFDEETGLHYNRHRYYSPNTGRFVTADPIGLAGGLNNYQYVPNPTGWVDPLGLANIAVNGACCGKTRRRELNEKFNRTGDLNNDINIRERKHKAFEFYKSQGFSEPDIPSHLSGIDFNQPVEVITLNNGKKLYQYQSPGAPQGNYYAVNPSTQPTELGISPMGFNRAFGEAQPKVQTQYITTNKVQVLKSKAKAIDDFWSVKGQTYSTQGGGVQLFSAQKDKFKAVNNE